MIGRRKKPGASRANVQFSYQQGMSVYVAAAVAFVILAIGIYAAFFKALPLQDHYEIQAVFKNSNLLAARGPVRIAGVDVGQVKKVERYKNTDLSVVTMRIEDRGQPIHTDARLKIRPRLFLEGNFFVDLQPGSPQADEVKNGGIIPVAQTATPVQLDQVLTALQADTRKSLQETLVGLGEGFGTEPSAADDAQQDPSVRGLTGGQAINKALEKGPAALRDGAVVGDAFQGTRPHDLSRMTRGFTRALDGLGRNENQLRDFITDFDTTMQATAAAAPDLERTVGLLGPTAANMRKGFKSLRRGLPATAEFTEAITPGVIETPATIDASYPWLDQAYPLLGPNEAGGLLKDLQPATGDLARLAEGNRRFLPAVDRFNRCALEVLIPTGDIKVDGGPGVENYKEFFYGMVGQAAEGQNFDGNGPFLRLSAASGPHTVRTGPTNYTGDPLFANAVNKPLRTRPAFAGKVPPIRRDVPCYKNGVPDVNGPASVGPADGTAPNAAPPEVPVDPTAPTQPEGTVSAASAQAPKLVPIGEAGR